MSQKVVYELLEELGGKATTTQVSELAKKKYPKYTVYTYVSVRLKSLKKWGYVTRNNDGIWSTTRIRPYWKAEIRRNSEKQSKL